MQKDKRELYPKWINNINNNKYVSGFTNDMDGLLCSAFAKHHLGLEVNAFYDFRSMNMIDPNDKRELIFFDAALCEGKVFDNHMTRSDAVSSYNTQSANINNVTDVHLGRYTDKFAMSTLIQLYAIYNIPLPTTLQGKLILLCCDVGFKGYYDSRYKMQFLSYLKMFNMLELIEVLDMFTQSQMYEFMLMAQMNAQVVRNSDGTLWIEKNKSHPSARWIDFDTGMNLDFFTKHLEYPVELPRGSFKTTESFKTQTVDSHAITSQMKAQAFSYAYINKNKVMMSLKKENNYEGNYKR